MFTRQQNGWKMGKMVFLFGFLLFLIPTLVFAQEYPAKPINILVSHATGGTVDNSVRLLANAAEKILGQPIIITNNAGGGGAVALGIVIKERPDGYHLAAGASHPLILVPQFRTVTYKFEDFVPILSYTSVSSGILVRGDSPWKTLKEFVEYAKKNPAKVTYTVSGTGSIMHLAMEYVAKQEGIQWTAIPYTSGDPNYPLLGGHVTACSSGPAFYPYAKAGTLRLLASYGQKRGKKEFPDVPTLRELGYDFVDASVYMITASKLMPLSIVKKLDDAFRKAVDNQEFINYMEKMNMEVIYRNHEDTKKFLEEAYDRYGKLITELKIPKEK
jgi:tripartite-type tricarboxylate transporter receptor subunit TctC